MTKQETFLLNIFKANLAKEMSFLNILHYIMKLKKTEDSKNVDVLGIINSLENLAKSGRIAKQEKGGKNFWGDKSSKIVYFRVKGMPA